MPFYFQLVKEIAIDKKSWLVINHQYEYITYRPQM